MKKNMGGGERLIRIAVASIFAYLYFAHIVSGILAIVLLTLAGVFLVTGLISFCPIWMAIGIRTNNPKTQQA